MKSALSETASGTHKTETFPTPRVLMVMMSRKKTTFDGLSTKEDIVDALTIYNEENLAGGVSEATLMETDDLRNECVR